MVGRKTAEGAGLAGLPDVEFMQTWLARVGAGAADLATDAAQQIIYDAWEARDIVEQYRLALAALDQSPLCGDAFSVLASIMPEHAAALFARGMVAAELALGPQRFAAMEGEFWGYLGTLPESRWNPVLSDLYRCKGLGSRGDLQRYPQLSGHSPQH